jgi:uncharacterized protein YycO
MNPTNLKTGDVLHCRGKRLLSNLIAGATKSKFSHTALFVEIWGQPYVIDAQKDGVNVRPWDAWMKEYDYTITAMRSPNKLQEKSFAARALTKVGHTGYDFESLFLRQPSKLLTGKWKIKGNEDERMYCSEYVAWVYGVEKSYRMSPEDFYNWCIINNFTEIKLS